MRRVYRTVSIASTEGGFEVRLDGRPLRTPAKRALAVPTHGLAEAIAHEWAAQGEILRPSDMHLTQLANTAIDRIAADRQGVIDAVAAYGETDLLCHRAAGPATLVQRQAASWQPLLDWLAGTYGAALIVTEGVLPQPQPAEALAAIRAAVARLDDLSLTAVHHATALLGSAVLALAVHAGRLDAAAAMALSHVDEDFQSERWGEDSQAADRRRAMLAELTATELFLRLLRR